MSDVSNIGRSSPLGAVAVDGGVNLSLYSRTATGVELLLFDRAEDTWPARVVRIDPVRNRWIDTALDSPNDIVAWQTAPEVAGESYRAAPRSVVTLFSSSKG